MPDDYYVSQYSGEEIDALLRGAGTGTVRYDAAQTLTDAQKAQARNNISAMQGIESTDHPGCNYVLNGSTVEWINPPMQLGVEYRTTERYRGKPVYIRLEEIAALPNNTTLTVSKVGVPSGGTLYVDNIVDYRAEFYSNSTVYSIPCNDVVDIPECSGIRYGSGITYSIRTKGVDYSNYAGRIWIKYTKQTD